MYHKNMMDPLGFWRQSQLPCGHWNILSIYRLQIGATSAASSVYTSNSEANLIYTQLESFSLSTKWFLMMHIIFFHVPTAASTSYNHYLINTLEIAELLAPLPSLHLLLVLLQLSPSLDTHQLLFSLPTPVTPSSESLYRFFLPSYSLMKYFSEVPTSSALLPMSMFVNMTSCKTIFLSDNDGYINLSFDDGC